MNRTHLINTILVIAGLVGMLFTPPTPARAQSPFDCAAVTEIPQSECQALVAFYNATAGDGWYSRAGWLQTTTPCSWHGVTCSVGHVSQIVLKNNAVRGPVPPEFGNLSALTALDLSENATYDGSGEYPPEPGITALPPEIANLSALTTLDLHWNNLTTLPSGLNNTLANLTYLDLEGNDITTLPADFGGLANLTTLNLSDNYMTALPAEFGNFPNLTSLDLFMNSLTALPPGISNLHALTNLHLGTNSLTTLPSEIGDLTHLITLTIFHNNLTTLPPEIGNLAALQELDLRVNALPALPPEIGNLVHLNRLFLDNNALTSLPAEIVNLAALQKLYINTNSLTTLPAGFDHLTALQELGLCNNALNTPPPEISNLVNLTALSLCSNALTTLPPGFDNLVKLAALDLSSNALTTLPPEFGNLVKLAALDLSSNALTTLPPGFNNLVSMTTLDLSSNALTSLSPEFNNLVKLTTLDLSSNALTTLPPGFGDLTEMTKLHLEANALTALPPGFGNLTQLTHLYLSGNALTALPPEFGNLSALLHLDMEVNPLRGAIPDFMAQLTSLKYFFYENTEWCVSVTGPISAWFTGRHVEGNRQVCSPLAALNLDPSPELYAHIGAFFTATVTPLATYYPITFTWSTGDGLIVTHISAHPVTDAAWLYWDTPGAHTLTVTAANELGVITTTQPVFVQSVSSVAMLPDAPTTLDYIDPQGLSTTIGVPAGSVNDTAYLRYLPQTVTEAIPGWRPAGHSFALDLYREGRVVTDSTFLTPVSLTIHYSEADIAAIDRPANLRLMRWDTMVASWQPAACGPVSHDLEQRALTLPLCQVGQFALFGPATLTKFVAPATIAFNGAALIYYTLVFSDPVGSSGEDSTTLRLFDPISPTLAWLGFVGAPPAGITFSDGAITGTLTLSSTQPLTLSFTVRAQLPDSAFVNRHAVVTNTAYFCPTNTACIFRPSNTVSSDITSAYSIFLPLILR